VSLSVLREELSGRRRSDRAISISRDTPSHPESHTIIRVRSTKVESSAYIGVVISIEKYEKV